MNNNDQEAQHRFFVHNTINRLNNNSFQIKAIMITIVGAFIAIYASTSKDIFFVIPCPLIFIFWLLDSYYLQQEKKFRGIYNDICDLVPKNEKKTKQLFEINPKIYKGGKYNFFRSMFSLSFMLLYLALILLLLLIYVLVKNNFINI